MANEQVQIQVGVNAAGVQAGMDAAGKAAAGAANQAEKATKKASAATDGWQAGLRKLRAQARLFGADIIGRLTAAYGVLALFDKLVNVTAESMQRSLEISKASRKAGLGAEDYQRVSRIAEEAGASVDEAAKAAGNYARMIGLAAQGNLQAIETLKALGYTDEQVRKGNISTIDVLSRISTAYRNASTEAERLNIIKNSGLPKELLEAGPTAVSMAGGAGVTNAAAVERRAAEQTVSGRPGGFWASFGEAFYDMFISDVERRTSNIMGRGGMDVKDLAENAMFGAGAAEAGAKGVDTYGIRTLQAQLGREGITAEERSKLETQLKEAFGKFADDFRVAFTGTTQGGVVQTRDLIEAELQRKFNKMFPGAGGGASTVLPVSSKGGEKVEVPVSSLQAIGGGGGFYAGATDMVSLATRTAEATEAIARNTERMANQRGGSPSSPAVYISAD